GHCAHDVSIVQRHFDALIGVLIVHEVNAVQRVHVGLRQPVQQVVIGGPDRVKVQDLVGQRSGCGSNLLTADLVAAPVDGVQQCLGHVDASSKELHLFANGHGRNTAGNRAVITAQFTDQSIRFVLDGGGVD